MILHSEHILTILGLCLMAVATAVALWKSWQPLRAARTSSANAAGIWGASGGVTPPFPKAPAARVEFSTRTAGGTETPSHGATLRPRGADSGTIGAHGRQPVQGTGVEPLKPDGVPLSGAPITLRGESADAPKGGDGGIAGADARQPVDVAGVEPPRPDGVVRAPKAKEPAPPVGEDTATPAGGAGGGVGTPPMGPPVATSDSELRGYFFVIRGLRRKVG